MGSGRVTFGGNAAMRLRALLDAPGSGLNRDLDRRANQVLSKARTLCPVDEGRLRGSLHVDARNGPKGPYRRIGTNLEYAIFVHEGTGIYAGRGRIRPRSASVLRWRARSGGGRDGYVYARSTRGMRGRPFLEQALLAAR